MKNKILFILTVAALLLYGCDSSNTPSSTTTSGDNEILEAACNSLGDAGMRKQCLSALERTQGASKPIEQTKKTDDSQATRELITFRGIPLGVPGQKIALSELCRQNASNKPRTDEKDPCDPQEMKGYFFVSYGNLVDRFGSANRYAKIELSDNGELESVLLHSVTKSSVLELVEILQEKYGAPRKTTNSVENGRGTKFDQEIFVWVDAQGNRITAWSIYEKIDEGRVTIESSARVSLLKEAEKLLKEASKLNL